MKKFKASLDKLCEVEQVSTVHTQTVHRPVNHMQYRTENARMGFELSDSIRTLIGINMIKYLFIAPAYIHLVGSAEVMLNAELKS